MSVAADRAIPALFVSHGAAFFTTDPADDTHRFLRGFAATVAAWRPRAIVVISAHHRAAGPRLATTGAGPLETVHDHPAQKAFHIRWPARGDTALLARVSELLRPWAPEADAHRGLDHGAWVPLSLLRPAADLPTIAVSLHSSDDPQVHFAVGRALAPLRREGVLIVGSGGVTHNQAVFRESFFANGDVRAAQDFSKTFDEWARGVLCGLAGAPRLEALAAFGRHPLAQKAHPTTEHFLPLLVVAGAAENEPVARVFSGFQHSLSTAAFQLGDAPRPGDSTGATVT